MSSSHVSRNARIQWEPIPGAARYVYKIAAQRITHLTLEDLQVHEPFVLASIESDGAWYCAVAGVDEAGNIGEAGLREIHCDTYAAMPVVMSPV